MYTIISAVITTSLATGVDPLGPLESTRPTIESTVPAAWIPSPWRQAEVGGGDRLALSTDPVLIEDVKRAVEIGAPIRLAGVPLPDGSRVGLELEPFAGFTRDARIEIVEANGVVRTLEVPATIALGGRVTGVPGSDAFIAFGPSGVEGWITIDDVAFGVSDGPGLGTPSIHRLDAMPPIDPDLLENFCQADLIDQPMLVGPRPLRGVAKKRIERNATGIGCQRIRLAIETDSEFLGLFNGDPEAAAGYVATLCAATSFIYDRDVDTTIVASSLRLWSGEDPWDGPGAGEQLTQFREYWESNESANERDLAHFLSGRGLGGGVAWLPGLCGSYAYAVSGNLNGSFPYPIQDNSGANWDLMVFTHELGHNCGMPHTHDIGVDNCAGGDCINTGTIMSYCHICSGGLANVRLGFCAENVLNMRNTLANISCDYTIGPDDVAQPDFARTSGGVPVLIDAAGNDVGMGCGFSDIVAFDAVSDRDGTIERVEDWGPDGRSALRYTPRSDFAGVDTFEYVVQPDGVDVTGTVTIVVEGLRPPSNPNGTTPGARADFYELPNTTQVLPDFDLLTPYGGSIHPTIDYPSTGGTFADTGRSDDVGVVWTGWVEIPATGTWTFTTESDDGSRLLIGEEIVVSNDGTHGMRARSGSIGLIAGKHPIRVEFFERAGGAGCFVQWTGPGRAFETVPASAWSHGGTLGPIGDLNGDGRVDGSDIGRLLAGWGSDGPTDLDGDGTTNGADLGALLAGWSG